jgi:hypothetical protein
VSESEISNSPLFSSRGTLKISQIFLEKAGNEGSLSSSLVIIESGGLFFFSFGFIGFIFIIR